MSNKKIKYLIQLILLFYSYKKYNTSCDKHLASCFKEEMKKTFYDIIQII